MNKALKEVRHLLCKIRDIMNKEGELNWIMGIDIMINLIDQGASLRDIRSSYNSMTRGVDSFADYGIDRDDFAERVAANREFDRLRDELWKKLS